MKEVNLSSVDYKYLADQLYMKLFENDNLGEFEILIPGYLSREEFKLGHQYPEAYKVKVNVVFKKKRSTYFRMSVIVIEQDGLLQDFYYNNGERRWKLLSEPGDPMRDWWMEEDLFSPGFPDIPEQFKDKMVSEGILDHIEYLEQLDLY